MIRTGARGRALARFSIVLALLGAAGCDDKKKADPAAPAADLARRVLEAAEQDIRQASQAPDQVRFRGVTVWPQALPRHFAVCGLVRPFVGAADLYVPFVAIIDVTQPPGTNTPSFTSEPYVASTTAAATRVYVALTNYCYEGGGPLPGPIRGPMPLPPLPETVPDPRGAPGDAITPDANPSPAGQPPAASTSPTNLAPQANLAPQESAASGSATMRRNGNLHAAPQGEVVRVVPQGTPLHIFAQAPADGTRSVMPPRGDGSTKACSTSIKSPRRSEVSAWFDPARHSAQDMCLLVADRGETCRST